MEVNRKQALELIKRLAGLYPNGPLTNDYAREEYVKEFFRMDFDLATIAVNESIKICRFCPSIAEIRGIYLERLSDANKNKKIDGQCNVCKNSGVILVKKDEYTYGTYCTECERGQTFNYNGRNCTERKSEYYCAPITQYCKSEEVEFLRGWNDIIVV